MSPFDHSHSFIPIGRMSLMQSSITISLLTGKPIPRLGMVVGKGCASTGTCANKLQRRVVVSGVLRSWISRICHASLSLVQYKLEVICLHNFAFLGGKAHFVTSYAKLRKCETKNAKNVFCWERSNYNSTLASREYSTDHHVFYRTKYQLFA